MAITEQSDFIIGSDDPILITGANGFIGVRVVENLLDRGFRELLCLTRPSSDSAKLEVLAGRRGTEARIRVVKGNLLSRHDCAVATKEVALIFHLAAGGSDKSFPDAFMNTVVTTRNLLDASLQCQSLKRFVNVSSFAVYSNRRKPQGRLLDESCPIETRAELRGDAYCFAKIKQDAIVAEYGERFGLPYVIVRPGYVYGPGKKSISSRVGIDTFGIFLHLGGSNTIPFTYVDNCADAIVTAGLKRGVEGEVFNIVDDDLPSSRRFLRLHKRNVGHFKSIYLPHFASRSLCWMWEKCAKWSEGQLPPTFNLRRWHALWKKTRYSNEKLKTRVGWIPKTSTGDGLRRYFESCRSGGSRA
jgi:nucleoside-diphosphate-sugar epimerase